MAAFSTAIAMTADPDLVEIAISVLLPLPVLAFVGGWIWIELRVGRRLMPRLEPDRSIMTRARARVERRAAIYGSLLVLVLAGAPALSSILGGGRPGLTALASPFMWVWIAYVFGLERIRQGMIVLLQGAASVSLDTDDVRQVLLGLALSRSEGGVAEWDIDISVFTANGVPRPRVTAVAQIPPPQPGAPTLSEHRDIAQTDEDMMALIGAATGNGNPYRLHFAKGARLKVYLSDLSSHEKMKALHAVKAARELAAAL